MKIRTDDIILPRPNIHVNRIEDGKERETPRDSINDNTLSGREELVNDGTE